MTDAPVAQAEEYLELFGIEKERVGIVIGPRLDLSFDFVDLEVNIRLLEGDDTGAYAADGTYTYEGVEWDQFLEEIYPTIIERFERVFEEAELQYYQP